MFINRIATNPTGNQATVKEGPMTPANHFATGTRFLSMSHRAESAGQLEAAASAMANADRHQLAGFVQEELDRLAPLVQQGLYDQEAASRHILEYRDKAAESVYEGLEEIARGPSAHALVCRLAWESLQADPFTGIVPGPEGLGDPVTRKLPD